jgi:hypothetical protein
MHDIEMGKKDVNVLVNATNLDYVPRYIKQPALMAPRILLAVSDDVATAAPTMTPTKLVQATELGEKENA